LFEVDKTDGGALTSGLTPYITKFGDLTVNKGTVESTPFGSAVSTYLLGVIRNYEPIVIEGFFNDAAEPAPDVVFNPARTAHALTRTFSLTIGGARVIGGELWITNYKRGFEVGGYTTYAVTVQFTGTITEA
jgi:hypothetical protein